MMKLHKSRLLMSFPELQKIDSTSSIKMILQVRLYMTMKQDDYTRFLEDRFADRLEKEESTLQIRFRNEISMKAKKEFVDAGKEIDTRKLAVMQSSDLLV